jgi:hypothetical protein
MDSQGRIEGLRVAVVDTHYVIFSRCSWESGKLLLAIGVERREILPCPILL